MKERERGVLMCARALREGANIKTYIIVHAPSVVELLWAEIKNNKVKAMIRQQHSRNIIESVPALLLSFHVRRAHRDDSWGNIREVEVEAVLPEASPAMTDGIWGMSVGRVFGECQSERLGGGAIPLSRAASYRGSET